MPTEQETIEHILNEIERERRIVFACGLVGRGLTDSCGKVGKEEARYLLSEEPKGETTVLIEASTPSGPSYRSRIYRSKIVTPKDFVASKRGIVQGSVSSNLIFPFNPCGHLRLFGVTPAYLGAIVSTYPDGAVELCEKGLSNDDEEVRKSTAGSLSVLAPVRPDRFVELYEKGLDDEIWEVRRAAARSLPALAPVRPDKFIRLYRKGLDDGDNEVIIITARSLPALAPVRPDRYIQLYKEGLAYSPPFSIFNIKLEKYIRQIIAESLSALVKVKPNKATEFYERGLANEDEGVRVGTAKALSPLAPVRPNRFIELYNQGMSDECLEVRISTAKSLPALTPIRPDVFIELCKAGLTYTYVKRETTIPSIDQLTKTAIIFVGELAKSYKKERIYEDVQVRKVIAQSLPALVPFRPDDSVELYKIGITHKDEPVIIETVKSLPALASVRPDKFVELYEIGLSSKYKRVRKLTFKSLEKSILRGDNRLIEFYWKILKGRGTEFGKLSILSLRMLVTNAALETTLTPYIDPEYEFIKAYLDSNYSRTVKGELRPEVELTTELKEFIQNPNRDYCRLIRILKAGRAKNLDDMCECAEIKISNYQIFRRLGGGAIKSVYEGENELDPHHERLAIKVYHPTKKGEGMLRLRGEKVLDTVKKEYWVKDNIVRELGLKHLNGIIDAFFDSTLGYFISIESVCNSGSLLDYSKELREGGPLPYRKTVDYTTQIYLSLEELRKLGFSHHGDLKFQNVLVHIENGIEILKLTDFGQSPRISMISELSRHPNVGYPATMAPDLLGSYRVPDLKSDLWSLGVMLYKMFIGEYPIPFKEPPGWKDIPIERRIEEFDKTFKIEIENLGQDGIYRKIDEGLSKIEVEAPYKIGVLKDILRGLLALEPQQRLSYDQLGAYLKQL